MSKINTGGPAFPCLERGALGLDLTDSGMTLRDYMAIHASDGDVDAVREQIREETRAKHGVGILPDNWRSTARYMHADAMIKAREGGAA